MLSCGGTLTYLSIDKHLFTSDLIFIAKFFVGLIVLITIGVLFYFLYKFRILTIDSNKIVEFYPFLLKKEKIDLTKIKNLKWENFFASRGTVYRKVTISDFNGTLEINDLEFENFEKLTSELKIDPNKKREINLEQAKSNLSNMNFNVYLLSAFLILLMFLVFRTIYTNGFHPIMLVFSICCGLILYASIKRKLEYKRTLKAAHNTL